jgi:purine-binding chemotaxis protein CheW
MTSLTAPPQCSSTAQKHAQRGGKYLTFGLGQEEFAIQVMRVRESRGIQAITTVPQTPDFGNGVEIPYILGMAKIKSKMKILLDINSLFTAQEVERIEGVTGFGA